MERFVLKEEVVMKTRHVTGSRFIEDTGGWRGPTMVAVVPARECGGAYEHHTCDTEWHGRNPATAGGGARGANAGTG